MTIDEILALEPAKTVKFLSVPRVDVGDKETARKAFDGDHAIKSDPNRQPKTVGEGVNARLVTPNIEILTYQKKITVTSTAFLFGAPVKLSCPQKDASSQDSFKAFKTLWDALKLDYFNARLMETVCIEREAAELWYAYKDAENITKIRVILLSAENGDQIFPHFDMFGDMDAFCRKYTVSNEKPDGGVEKIERFDVYMADRTVHYRRIGGTWSEDPERPVEPNIFKKIPVVYYSQRNTEWADVQTLIERAEDMISNHADLNDYFAGPMLQVFGELLSAPDKKSMAKMLQFKGIPGPDGKINYGHAEYLVWEHSPESLKIEMENVRGLIHSLSHTPDLSFDNVKGLGNISGIALKLMFLDALIKRANKEQRVYGEGISRRISLMKAILGAVNLSAQKTMAELKIDFEFGSILPDDLVTLMQNLTTGTGGRAVMSQRTAVNHNPLVDDVDAEMKQIETEQSGDMAGSLNL